MSVSDVLKVVKVDTTPNSFASCSTWSRIFFSNNMSFSAPSHPTGLICGYFLGGFGGKFAFFVTKFKCYTLLCSSKGYSIGRLSNETRLGCTATSHPTKRQFVFYSDYLSVDLVALQEDNNRHCIVLLHDSHVDIGR